jgi:hypothetical protein
VKTCGKSARSGHGDIPGGQTLRIVSPCKPVVETGSVDLDVTVRNIGGLGATGTEQSVSQINDRDRGVKTGIQNPAYRHIAHF